VFQERVNYSIMTQNTPEEEKLTSHETSEEDQADQMLGIK